MPTSDPTAIIGKPIVDQPWDDFDAVLAIAERARRVSDIRRAHSLYTRLVEINPNDARGWIGLAETTPDLDERIMRLSYALAILPANEQVRTQLDACIDDKLAHTGIADVLGLIVLGRAVAELHQRAPAHRLLTRATELDPTNLEGWLWRAGVADDIIEMIDCLHQALALDPENPRAKAGLKWALEKEKTNGTIHESKSDSARFAYEQGECAFQAGNLHQAHDHFKRATLLNPNDVNAWFWRGSTSSTIAEALLCMERVLKIDPANHAAREAHQLLRIKQYREKLPASPPSTTLINVAPAETPPTSSPQTGSPAIKLIIVLFVLFILIALVSAIVIRFSL